MRNPKMYLPHEDTTHQGRELIYAGPNPWSPRIATFQSDDLPPAELTDTWTYVSRLPGDTPIYHERSVWAVTRLAACQLCGDLFEFTFQAKDRNGKQRHGSGKWKEYCQDSCYKAKYAAPYLVQRFAALHEQVAQGDETAVAAARAEAERYKELFYAESGVNGAAAVELAEEVERLTAEVESLTERLAEAEARAEENAQRFMAAEVENGALRIQVDDLTAEPEPEPEPVEAVEAVEAVEDDGRNLYKRAMAAVAASKKAGGR
jgi:hypothetical protein